MMKMMCREMVMTRRTAMTRKKKMTCGIKYSNAAGKSQCSNAQFLN